MQNENFKDPVFMKKWMIYRKKDSKGQKVQWLKLKWMSFEKKSPFTMYFKQTLQKDFGFFCVDMARFRPTRWRTCTVSSVEKLPQLHSSPRPIHPLKKRDIIELLDYVPRVHHLFFHNLTTDESAPLQHPDDAGFQIDIMDDENTISTQEDGAKRFKKNKFSFLQFLYFLLVFN